MSRRGRTRRSRDERLQQLITLCAQRPHTVVELSIALGCSDGLIRYYLRQLPDMHVVARPQPQQRSVLVYSWHEQAVA